MAQTVLLKRSSVAGNVPGSSDLALGEIAVNTADGAVYIKKGNNDIVAVADNDILHIDTTNSRIGIGTTSPETKLHIQNGSDTSPAVIITGGHTGRRLKIQSYQTGGAAGAGFIFNADSSYGAIKLQTTSKDRLTMNSGGDISFYEDTGTAAKFFWDASTEKLGIGTTAAGAALTVHHALPSGNYLAEFRSTGNSHATIDLRADGTGDPRIFFDLNGATPFAIGVDNSDGDKFKISGNYQLGTNDRLVINSSGNVGIGTSSPSVHSGTGLVVHATTGGSGNTGSPRIRLTNTTTGQSATDGAELSLDGNTKDFYIENREGQDIIFYSGSERVRIDSAGSLLVGKSSADIGTIGHQLLSDVSGDYAAHTSNGTRALLLNRLNSDGTIAEFRKTGSVVGSIGTAAGNLYIVSNDVGLNFAGGGDGIYPATTNGGQRDSAIDLGASTHKFKDLYLSGVTNAAGFQSNQATNGFGYLNFGDTGDANIGQIGYDHTNNYMRFQVNNTEKARIDSSGNLLVGTTSGGNSSAGFRAYAGGNGAFTIAGTTLSLNRLSSNGEILNLQKDTVNVGSIGVGGSNKMTIIGTNANLQLGANNTALLNLDTNKFYPQTDNSVDLGFSSSAGRFRDLYLTGAANASILNIKSGTSIVGTITTSSSSLALNARNTGIMLFQSGGSEKARIDSSGRLGIGTNNPLDLLHIKSSSTDARLVLDAASGADPELKFFEAGNVKYTIGHDAATSKFVIGTANVDTQKRFTINSSGAITFNEAYTFPTSDGSANQVLQTDGSGNLTFAAVSGGGGVSISNNANNRVLTGDGTNANAEANLTFDGTNLDLPDNKPIRIGTGNDLSLYHDGTDSRIHNATGDLYIRNNANDKDIIFQSEDGSGGTTTYFTVDGSARDVVFNKDIKLNDNVRVDFGNSSDLRITHNATNSFITNHTGDLKLIQYADDGDISFQSDDGSGGITPYLTLDGGNVQMIASQKLAFNDNVRATFGNSSDLEIYHDGSNSIINDNGTGTIRIQTGGSNQWEFNGVNFKGNDGRKIILGDSSDLQIYHDGSNSYIKENGTGDLYLQGTSLVLSNSVGANYLVAYDGGSVNLYHNANQKLSTTSTGVQITGTLDVDVISNASGVVHLNDTLYFQDNSKAVFGDSSDLQIYHNGSNSYIDDVGTGALNIRSSGIYLEKQDGSEVMASFIADGASTLYYDNNIKFVTKADGVDITGELQSDSLDVDGNADISGNLVLSGNLTVNGSTVTNSATNTTIEDALIELGSGNTGANSNDLGLILERGTSGNNAFIGFDESDDQVVFALTTATGSSTGNLAFSSFLPIRTGTITAGSGSGTALDLNGSATVSGSITFDGTAVYNALNMANNNIVNVNNISISDPGPNEGVQWSNIKIFESPDDLTTNSSGNFQIVYGSTRRFTVNNVGADVNGELMVNGAHNNSGKADFAVEVGGSYSQLSLYGDQVQAGSTDMNYNAKFFHDANGGQVAIWDNNLTFTIQGSNTGSATARDIIFKPQTSGTAVATERMRIKGDGKVGIGTSTPLYPLHVAGNIYSSAGDLLLDQSRKLIWGNSQQWIQASNNGQMKFIVNNGERFYIQTDGRYESRIKKHFRVNDVGNLGTTIRYYKIATVNKGNSGITIKGTLANHVESYGTGKFDLAIFGREDNNGANISVNGTVEAASANGGVRIVKQSGTGSYINYDVYIVVPKYAHVDVEATIHGNSDGTGNMVDWHGNGTYVTTAPTGAAVELNTSTLAAGHYSVIDSTIKMSLTPTGLGIGTTSPTDLLTISGDGKYIAHHDGTRYAFKLGADSSGDGNFMLHDGVAGAVKVKLYAEANEANYINNGGNFGIGTSSPAFKLDVQEANGNTLARFKDSDSSHSGIVIAGDTNAGWVGNDVGVTGEGIYYQSSNNFMRFYTNSSEQMRIDNSGRLLVNATSTVFNDKLYIGGDGYATGGWRTGTGATFVGELTNLSGKLALQSDASRDIQLGDTNNPDIVYIDTSAQNVGIGTSSPSTTLHIQNTSTNAEVMRLTTTGDDPDRNMYFQSDHIYSNGNFYLGTGSHRNLYRGSYHTFHYGGSNTEAMRVNTNGNVGIGSTSPQDKLNIHDSSSSANLGIKITRGGQTHGLRLGVNDSHAFLWTSENQNLAFATSGTQRMTIASAGNVGIGTTSPTSKLHINSGTSDWPIHAKSTDAKAGIILSDTNTTNYLISESYTLSIGNQASVHASNLNIKSTGNVGIGTTTPAKPLHVQFSGDNGVRVESEDSHSSLYIDSHTGYGQYIRFSENNTNRYWLNSDTNGRLLFRPAASGVEANLITFDATGQVGIGKTTVKAKLQVEEYGVDTTSTASSATTQIAVHTFAAADFRSARFTVQVTNSTDSTYHTTELLLVHNGTTANITEFGEIHTGSAVEATFDADVNSGNVRLLATPASTDTMAFKVVCHSITT